MENLNNLQSNSKYELLFPTYILPTCPFNKKGIYRPVPLIRKEFTQNVNCRLNTDHKICNISLVNT